MLNIGLKNAILFLLIILILHFLIKNILVDRKPETPAQQSYFEKFTEQRKKIMNFINSDEETELNKAFDQKLIKECTSESTCLPRKSDEHILPLSTTCDAGIQELKPDDPMKLKADCQLPQDYKSFMVIKEYENEKGMNGGKLFDGLDAYDGFEDYFESYKTSCQ